MSARTLRILSVLVLAAAPAAALTGFWWWALAGLRYEVGVALGATVFVALCGGAALAIAASEKEFDERKVPRLLDLAPRDGAS